MSKKDLKRARGKDLKTKRTLIASAIAAGIGALVFAFLLFVPNSEPWGLPAIPRAQLAGHKHEAIGKTVGLQKTSSVSLPYLVMKERVAKEKELHRRVRRIEEALAKSKQQTAA